MGKPNYVRGFNRLYVVFVALWIIGYSLVPPYIEYLDATKILPTVEYSFYFDEHFGVGDGFWAKLICLPIILYLAVWLAYFMYKWIVGGFKRDQ